MPLKEDVYNLLVFWFTHLLENALNPKKKKKKATDV